MQTIRLRRWPPPALAVMALASLTACLVYIPLSVHGDPERPTIEPEGRAYCGAHSVLEVSQLEPKDGTWVETRLWALEPIPPGRVLERIRYGDVPAGWKLADWLPENVARTPVVGNTYVVRLNCNKYRGFGAFELTRYSGGLRLRNLDRDELTRREEASRAGSSPARR